MARIIEHKWKVKSGFSSRYDVNILVWFDQTNDVYAAIQREKQIKKWYRKWKLELIEKSNPDWKDLFYEIGGTDEMLATGFPLPRE